MTSLYRSGTDSSQIGRAVSVHVAMQVGIGAAEALVMRRDRSRLRCLNVFAALLLSNHARAEGTDQLNTYQALRSGTQLYVDILDSSVESIQWTGRGNVSITRPDGSGLSNLSSGASIPLANEPNGAYGVLVNSFQIPGSRWDVSVLNPIDGGGRLFSQDWAFNAGSFAQARATQGSFYAVLPGGATGTDAVIELALQGLSGYVYNINANRVGPLLQGGRSVAQYGNQVFPEFPIYLQPPSVAGYGRTAPGVYGLEYIGGVSESVLGSTISPCNQVVPGVSFGLFQFNTNAEGTFHLQCDLDDDGVFESTNNDDLLLMGRTSIGLNTINWNAIHQGTPIAEGAYDCRVRVNVGEFHYVGTDIETSYPGFMLYEVEASGTRVPLEMYWNDSAVQSRAQSMPNGVKGLETSGASGILSAPYGTAATANVNARSWGNFNSSGKGNLSLLDTYTFLETSTSTTIEVVATNGADDDDGDGLSNFEESCYYGTDPDDADTDGNGVLDGVQYALGVSSSGVGGLESNGGRATQMATRAIRRGHMTPFFQRLKASSSLSSLVDSLALEDLETVEVTPSDLPSITNALDVVGLDFLGKNGLRQASILLIETVGAVYEHSKPLCDRAHGAELIQLNSRWHDDVEIVGGLFRGSGGLDQARLFKLYQEGEDWSVHSRWLSEDYPLVEEGQNVLNVQIWAREDHTANSLVGQLMNTVAPAEPRLVDEEVPNPVVRLPPTSPLPGAYFRRGGAWGQTLQATLARRGATPELRVLLETKAPQGDGTERRWLRISEGTDQLQVFEGFMKEATLELWAGDQRLDRLWLSDGWWAPYDQGLWTDDASRFSTERCLFEGVSVDASLAFAGCGRADRPDEGPLGVARHFVRPVQLGAYGHLGLHLESSAPSEVCLEDTESGRRRCRTVSAWDGELRLSGVLRGLEQADLLTVYSKDAEILEVSELRFDQETVEDPEFFIQEADAGFNCSSTDQPTVIGLLLGLLALCLRRRRC